jgi:NAD/NADP transhydrogenase alpha subunit
VQVLVESDTGAAAWFPDQAYQQTGARVLNRQETAARADVLAGVGAPAPDIIAGMRPGQGVTVCRDLALLGG